MAVSLSDLISDRATCIISVNDVSFAVEYAPSRISPRLMREMAAVDTLPAIEQVMVTSTIAHEIVTDWELHEDEPAELDPEDRPKIPLTVERLEDFPAVVLASIVAAVFAHMRLSKASGMTSKTNSSVASVANARPSVSSRPGISRSSRRKN